MASLMIYEGKLLIVGGKLAMDPACCCGEASCGCTPRPGSTLQLTISNVASCSCADGTVIVLTYNSIDHAWVGTGPGGGCALLGVRWRLSCSRTSDPNRCFDYVLDLIGNTACIAQSNRPVSCSCSPLNLRYDLHVAGLGCCAGSMTGAGDITVTITE